MKNNFFSAIFALTFVLFTCPLFGSAQTNFTGEIIYEVKMMDTSLQQIIDNREMFVFTNDTLSRIVTQNDALGEQVTIKHLAMNKSYLLMTMVGKKLAIQTNQSEDSTKNIPAQFKYKWFGKKKINGYVLKKATVYREDLKEKTTIWYFRDIRPDILDMYIGIRGLPADFYIGTIDGVVHYSIKSIENKPVAKDMFGIPSDYEKIKLEDFMKHVRGEEN
jgi:hypothetical protein